MKEKVKIIIIFIILGFVFYWFQWRPSEIRRSCFKTFNYLPAGTERTTLYQDCLHFHGLEK